MDQKKNGAQQKNTYLGCERSRMIYLLQKMFVIAIFQSRVLLTILHDPTPELPGPVYLSSPLILDLNDDGVKTIPLADGVRFDHDGNRFVEKSGWVSGDDALLVWDRNSRA